jgi:hypothetical protein
MIWSTSFYRLKSFPREFNANSVQDLVNQIETLYPGRAFDYEDYTDELHVFDGKTRRRRFANIQLG